MSEVTDQMWTEVCEFNRTLAEEFWNESVHLSPKSQKQYFSALRIFLYWVAKNCNNKRIVDIESRDYLKYQNWLQRDGMSEDGIRLKRSVVSSFNEYIMVYYQKEYPTFRNFITKQIKIPATGAVYKKEPLNPQEYQMLCEELEKQEEWQKLAYLMFSYSTGCRREEARQLLKEFITYEPIVKNVKTKDENGNETEVEVITYRTHDVRCKGKGELGKVRKLQVDEATMNVLKKWIEVRGEDDCPYMFITKYQGVINHVSETTLNKWCHNVFEKIINRRIHPHLFRESRATNLVVHGGKDITTAQKLLGHLSSTTTEIYVIREDTDDAYDAFI